MHPVAAALIPWFARNRRALPWRRDPRDPYAVWVSEVMLQQTQVATVVPYFERFLRRFPTVSALAEAPEEDVLKHWEGLGYYSRARNLRRAAQAMVARHGGKVPATYEALLALPGFGPYTAGAVASLAFGAAVPAVDGNVLRVASRVEALAEDVGTPRGKRAVEAAVKAWLPREEAGTFNEALMELGATVCTPRAPRCGACPLAHACRAHLAGREETYPVKTRKAAPAWEERVLVVAHRAGRVWVERPREGLLAGLWGFPTAPVAGEGGATQASREALAARGLTPAEGDAARVGFTFEKVFTHRRWRVHVVTVRAAHEEKEEEEKEEGRWVAVAALADLALGDPSRRVATWLAEAPRLS